MALIIRAERQPIITNTFTAMAYREDSVDILGDHRTFVDAISEVEEQAGAEVSWERTSDTTWEGKHDSTSYLISKKTTEE